MDNKHVLECLIEVLGLKANALASNVGVSSQSIYKALNNKSLNYCSKKLASKIIHVYPFVNELFLLTGKGSVLLDNYNMEQNIKIEEVLDRMSLALLNNSEANKVTAEAKLKGAEADLKNAENMERLTINLDKVISLLENRINNIK